MAKQTNRQSAKSNKYGDRRVVVHVFVPWNNVFPVERKRTPKPSIKKIHGQYGADENSVSSVNQKCTKSGKPFSINLLAVTLHQWHHTEIAWVF